MKKLRHKIMEDVVSEVEIALEEHLGGELREKKGSRVKISFFGRRFYVQKDIYQATKTTILIVVGVSLIILFGNLFPQALKVALIIFVAGLIIGITWIMMWSLFSSEM